MEHNQAKLEHLRETALSLHFAATSLLINIEEAENLNREKLGLPHCEASHNKFITLSAMKDRVRQMYGTRYR
ncbi:MAG: hypothetical protein LBE35_03025 [Clostridiales bacterium]|jgi:hypothetical protein|nr:hypothetical protein [Clostridiales bacterium]